ncbi:MAG: hypothetical protein ISS70_21575 [Phycisphaerae bacterium]|nr:hypothetical protein [Phycisphaerae bacterium]
MSELPVLSLSRSALKTIQLRKSAFSCQKAAYMRLKFGQNQGLWRHFGDTMSLGVGGVSSAAEEVDLGKNSDILGLAKMRSLFRLSARCYWRVGLPRIVVHDSSAK